MNLFGCKQDGQIVLLLNETASTSESSVGSCMMVVQADNLPFVSLPRSPCLDNWKVLQLKVFSCLNLIDKIPRACIVFHITVSEVICRKNTHYVP